MVWTIYIKENNKQGLRRRLPEVGPTWFTPTVFQKRARMENIMLTLNAKSCRLQNASDTNDDRSVSGFLILCKKFCSTHVRLILQNICAISGNRMYG